MSRIDAKCYPSEIQSGAGEMNCFKPAPSPASPSAAPSAGQAIASDIVNEIFDSALDTALANCQRRSAALSISPDLVGDILDNLKSPTIPDETSLLDDKLKKMINEMKFPDIGLGDSTTASDAKIAEIPEPKPARNTLERKKRLTNLVKNSKHILTKFVKSDDTNNASKLLKSSKSEESYEKLVRSINLDVDDVKMQQGSSRTAPRNLHFPAECSMEVVDLAELPQLGNKPGNKKKLKLRSRILQFFRARKNGNGSGRSSTTSQKSPRDDEPAESTPGN